MEIITEDSACIIADRAAGDKIARTFNLKPDKKFGAALQGGYECDHGQKVYRTSYGPKTNLGLARLVRGILDGTTD